MEDLTRYEPYTLHVYDLSYFSGKMQAYLRYKEIPHTSHDIAMRELATRVAPHTGLVEVPVVERADGVFMRDTTAMIEWFEARYPKGYVLPLDPASSYFCRLLEDYADEGLWRVALYYRWAFPKDALLNARRFTEDFLSDPVLPAFVLRRLAMRRQQRTYMRGEGITPENRADIERHYLDELADLEQIFQARPFLFGGKPSFADFGYFASMFRHFGIDPTPARLMRDRAPAVYEWTARMWNARASRLGSADWAATTDGLPSGLEPLLARAARRYLPVLHANAVAVGAGRETYDVSLDGRLYPGLRAMPFLAWRRAVLQRALDVLPAASLQQVRSVLSRTGCLEWLERDGVLACRFPAGDYLPLSRSRQIGFGEKVRMQLFGTPHHREAGRLRDEVPRKSRS
jgi:glutathione S-transferase